MLFKPVCLVVGVRSVENKSKRQRFLPPTVRQLNIYSPTSLHCGPTGVLVHNANPYENASIEEDDRLSLEGTEQL